MGNGSGVFPHNVGTFDYGGSRMIIKDIRGGIGHQVEGLFSLRKTTLNCQMGRIVSGDAKLPREKFIAGVLFVFLLRCMPVCETDPDCVRYQNHNSCVLLV